MKKFGLVLLPILTFPAIAAACDNKDKAQKDSNNPGTENIDSVAAELQKLKDELQDEITKASSKRNHYLGDYTDYAFEQSAKVIQAAVNAHNNAKTAEEVKDAIAKLKAGIKEIDSYYALSKVEKQKLAKKDFDKALKTTKEAKAKLTKPSAIEILDNSIAKAESNKEGDPHYFKNLLEWTSEYQKAIDEAQKLEKKSDEELWASYLLRESSIISKFEREFNTSNLFDDKVTEIKKLFEVAKKNVGKEYKKKEAEIRKAIADILDKINKEAITIEKSKELARSVSKEGELVIPDQYKYILSGAFAKTRNIKKVKFGENLEVIESEVFDNSSVETVEFNDKLKTLNGFNNTKITTLKLPKALEKFDGFKGTKIDNLTLPKTLKSMLLRNGILKEITFEDDEEFKNITSKTEFDKVVINKELFPSLEKIFVKSEEAKKKLIEKLKANGNGMNKWEDIVQIKPTK
ncbi:leucine-rich repeat protein [Mycoplasmopsis agalactiae]|uniref:leucine-rich repeat domain-containing protein n=1 Tax=Mycoplasmopsis agalactiae TaxID=2110 RepID=UPI00211C874D|nr:leucine-rich repeat protein [Mycoplasmopsis agalactiae]UUM25781.1 leucine-rich repeat protein [Mycoplasmopsis agalactiae]